MKIHAINLEFNKFSQFYIPYRLKIGKAGGTTKNGIGNIAPLAPPLTTPLYVTITSEKYSETMAISLVTKVSEKITPVKYQKRD